LIYASNQPLEHPSTLFKHKSQQIFFYQKKKRKQSICIVCVFFCFLLFHFKAEHDVKQLKVSGSPIEAFEDDKAS